MEGYKMNGTDMWKTYKKVEDENTKMRTMIEQCALIKRGALFKLQEKIEQNDKLYFAQIILICNQINKAMITDMTFDQVMKVKLLDDTIKMLTSEWIQRARSLHAEMSRIIKA